MFNETPSSETRSKVGILRFQGWFIMLEGSKSTTETVDTLRTGAASMKAMQKATYL
ncbi:hypothetical protein CASFOL_001841 [Castilleja foliolosa]|uniref:Uncharacterized protein n=1 Tax=Castilleja foliolosa TaxID=1961234 RepID=A0ABD3ECQ6_9LAMI